MVVLLCVVYFGLVVELVLMSMCGDEIFDCLLVMIGGKGLFFKELEVVMFEGCVEFVVYLFKDVLVELELGFVLLVILLCVDVVDVFVSNYYVDFVVLLLGVCVGIFLLWC